MTKYIFSFLIYSRVGENLQHTFQNQFYIYQRVEYENLPEKSLPNQLQKWMSFLVYYYDKN